MSSGTGTTAGSQRSTGDTTKTVDELSMRISSILQSKSIKTDIDRHAMPSSINSIKKGGLTDLDYWKRKLQSKLITQDENRREPSRSRSRKENKIPASRTYEVVQTLPVQERLYSLRKSVNLEVSLNKSAGRIPLKERELSRNQSQKSLMRTVISVAEFKQRSARSKSPNLNLSSALSAKSSKSTVDRKGDSKAELDIEPFSYTLSDQNCPSPNERDNSVLALLGGSPRKASDDPFNDLTKLLSDPGMHQPHSFMPVASRQQSKDGRTYMEVEGSRIYYNGAVVEDIINYGLRSKLASLMN